MLTSLSRNQITQRMGTSPSLGLLPPDCPEGDQDQIGPALLGVLALFPDGAWIIARSSVWWAGPFHKVVWTFNDKEPADLVPFSR
jgi:hypothetical protein